MKDLLIAVGGGLLYLAAMVSLIVLSIHHEEAFIAFLVLAIVAIVFFVVTNPDRSE